jgi:hypothetical protein
MAVQYNPGIVTDGLVLCLDAANGKSYQAGGTTWLDLSVNNNNATLINNPIFGNTNGGIFDFDGIDEYVSMGSPSPQSLNNQYASHEVWVKMDSPNNGLPQQLIARRNTTDGTFTMAKSTSNTLIFNTRNSSDIIQQVTLNLSLSTDWIHLVHTYDGTTICAYVNGVLNNFSTNLSGVLNTTGSFYIQIARNTNDLNFFDGKIGIVRIYNRALSAEEVAQNYSASRGRFGI